MKIDYSYEVRGNRMGRYTSAPARTLKDLTSIAKYAAWVAEQTAPRMKVLES